VLCFRCILAGSLISSLSRVVGLRARGVRMTFIASLISISLVRTLVVLAPELNNLPKSYVPSPDIVVALAWAFLVR